MNCLNTFLKYPGSAQCPFERILSQPQAADRSVPPEDSTAPSNQIQRAPHPPVHRNPAPKDRLWDFGGYIFIFLLLKTHVKSWAITLITTTKTNIMYFFHQQTTQFAKRKGSINISVYSWIKWGMTTLFCGHHIGHTCLLPWVPAPFLDSKFTQTAVLEFWLFQLFHWGQVFKASV